MYVMIYSLNLLQLDFVAFCFLNFQTYHCFHGHENRWMEMCLMSHLKVTATSTALMMQGKSRNGPSGLYTRINWHNSYPTPGMLSNASRQHCNHCLATSVKTHICTHHTPTCEEGGRATVTAQTVKEGNAVTVQTNNRTAVTYWSAICSLLYY